MATTDLTDYCIALEKPIKDSELTSTLLWHLKAARLKGYVTEYRFSPRLFRFDIAFPLEKLGIECDGGVWVQGRHTRGAGFERDCEKMNLAAKLGWRTLRFTRSMIESGQALKTIEDCLGK